MCKFLDAVCTITVMLVILLFALALAIDWHLLGGKDYREVTDREHDDKA